MIIDRNPGLQSTNLNTLTFGELTDLVIRNFESNQNYGPLNAKQLYISEMIGSGNGGSKRFQEIDIETYADSKPEGTNSLKSKVGTGYYKDMEAKTFSKEIDITVEMRNDNRYAQVGTLITNLSGFCENRTDLDLTHRLSFATSESYTNKNGETVATTTGDSLALCYSAHTLAFSSTTYRNRVSGDPVFSQGGLEAALQLTVTNIFTNFGEKRTMNFNTIVSGDDPSTLRAIKQVLQSTADVDAAQAGVTNVYMGAMKHVILPQLATTATGAPDSAKRRWWFIMATGQGANGWQAYYGEWIAPKLLTPSDSNSGMDIHNYNWTYSTYCRRGIATVSPKGIIGSCPTS